MNCFPDLTYSIYADGELSPEEALAVERHLASCARCRSLVIGLRQENQMLSEILSEPGWESEAVPAWPPERPRAVAGPLLAVLGALTGLRIAVGALFDVELSAGVAEAFEWLNPFHLNTQLELFFRSLFFVAEEGASMLALTFTLVGGLIVLLLAVFASLLLRRSSAQISATTLAMSLTLAAVLAAPPRAPALEVRRGQRMETIVIPADRTINDSLIASGESLTMDGTVTGNLIAVGRRVTVRGTVQGDLVVGCQSFELEGTVNGNVYAFSQTTTVRGKVGGSLHSFTQVFRLEPAATVEGDTLSFSADAGLAGTVARDVMAFSATVDARGKIGRNLSMFVDRAFVSSGATVGGKLFARVPAQDRLRVDSGAKITGPTQMEVRGVRGWRARLGQPRFYFWQAVQLAGAMIIGALLLALFPGFYRAAANNVGTWPRSLGLGFAALVAGPVAIVLLGVTLIGIPIAVAGLFWYILALYLAKIFTGAWLGQALLRRTPQTTADALLALLLGLLIIFVVVQIPFVGGIFRLLLFCLGMGAFTWRLYAARQTAAAGTTP